MKSYHIAIKGKVFLRSALPLCNMVWNVRTTAYKGPTKPAGGLGAAFVRLAALEALERP